METQQMPGFAPPASTPMPPIPNTIIDTSTPEGRLINVGRNALEVALNPRAKSAYERWQEMANVKNAAIPTDAQVIAAALTPQKRKRGPKKAKSAEEPLAKEPKATTAPGEPPSKKLKATTAPEEPKVRQKPGPKPKEGSKAFQKRAREAALKRAPEETRGMVEAAEARGAALKAETEAIKRAILQSIKESSAVPTHTADFDDWFGGGDAVWIEWNEEGDATLDEGMEDAEGEEDIGDVCMQQAIEAGRTIAQESSAPLAPQVTASDGWDDEADAMLYEQMEDVDAWDEVDEELFGDESGPMDVDEDKKAPVELPSTEEDAWGTDDDDLFGDENGNPGVEAEEEAISTDPVPVNQVHAQESNHISQHILQDHDACDTDDDSSGVEESENSGAEENTEPIPATPVTNPDDSDADADSLFEDESETDEAEPSSPRTPPPAAAIPERKRKVARTIHENQWDYLTGMDDDSASDSEEEDMNPAFFTRRQMYHFGMRVPRGRF